MVQRFRAERIESSSPIVMDGAVQARAVAWSAEHAENAITGLEV